MSNIAQMSQVLRPAWFLLAASFLLSPVGARASTVTVPDDLPSIQAAIDAGADTVLIRDGDYSEIPNAYRGVTLVGIGAARPRLRGLAVSNPFPLLSRRWIVRELQFTGPVTLTTSNPNARLLDIAFLGCDLRFGLRHDVDTSTDPYDILTFTLSGSTLGQGVLVNAAVVAMDADTLDAGAAFRVEEAVSVTGCWFRGAPDTALDITGAEPVVDVSNNVIEGYNTGVTVLESRQLTMRNNVVRKIGGYGAYIRGAAGTLLDNAVSDCGTGVRCVFSGVEASGNTFVRNLQTALWLDNPDSVRAQRNVFAHSGDFGMVIEVGFDADYRLTQNTFAENKRSGLALPHGTNDRLLLESNLFAGNTEWGLVIQGVEASIMLHCNDWYANGLGPAFGALVSSDDVSLNPFFCDMLGDDFSLYSDSPLLGQSQCGQVGALGVGCHPPILESIEVLSSRAGLDVTWKFEAASTVENWIERAENSAGPWDSLGTGTSAASNEFELVDGAVAPDRTYLYRVVWRDRGVIVRGDPIAGTWTDAGELSRVSPNPAIGEVNVGWVLSRPGTTDVRVYDLAGREISVVARGSFDVGRHEVRWDGRWDGRGVAPAGMYIVRISSAERTTSHRVLLLR